MTRNKEHVLAAFTVIVVALLILSFPLAAFASMDATPPRITADISGDTLTVTAEDDVSGISAIYVDGHRINEVTDGRAEVDLKDYAGDAAKLAVYAVDGAGNRSEEITLDNPYYARPAPNAPEDAVGQDGPDTPVGTDGGIGASSTPAAFTPDGTGTVLDRATEEDGKEFYTITTEAGNIFYLVIDSQREDGGVYFLNAVTEADLAALAQKEDEDSGFGSSLMESDPAEPEPESDPGPEPAPAPKPEESGGASAGTIIFALLAAIAVAGAAYYVKVVRPKKQAKDDAEDEEGWDSFFGEEVDEDEYEDDDFLPDEDIEEPGEDTAEPDEDTGTPEERVDGDEGGPDDEREG